MGLITSPLLLRSSVVSSQEQQLAVNGVSSTHSVLYTCGHVMAGWFCFTGAARTEHLHNCVVITADSRIMA